MVARLKAWVMPDLGVESKKKKTRREKKKREDIISTKKKKQIHKDKT